MKEKIIFSLSALTTLALLLKSKKADAWFSDTHSAIFETALEILKKDGKIYAYEFFNSCKDRISYGAIVPDFKGDRNKGSGMHYYSSCDKSGRKLQPTCTGYYANRLGEFAPSARTMLEENYTMSLIQYANDMTDMAFDSLGRCVHFISDTGCTVHTTNLISLPIKNNPHHGYEKYSLANMDRFHADGGDEELYNSYIYKSPGEMLNILSKESSKYYSDVKAVKDITFETALKNMLPITERHVAAFLNAYFEKLNDNVKTSLRTNKGYKIKSASDGAYLTVFNNKRAGLSKCCDSLNQTFGFKLNLDGSVRIINEGENLVCDGMFGFKFSKAFKNNGFRLTKTNDSYKITTEYSRFSKVLTNAKGCSKFRLFEKKFNPENNGQLWIIEKA